MLSADQLREAVEGAMELKKVVGEGVEEGFDETPLDHKEPTDAEFLAAFSMRMAEDPYFLYALPLVGGGLPVLRRFERLMAKYSPPPPMGGLF